MPLLRRALEAIPSTYRTIIALASPTLAAMISQTLINQADHILVGRLPAEESIPGQTALQNSLILLWAVGGTLSTIVGVGTQAFTARRLGERDDKRAGQVLTSSLLLSTVLGLVASIVFYLLTPYIFPLLVKDERVVALGVPFLRWRYVQILPMVVSISYKSFFDGIGKTWVHMGAAISMNIINFVLNLALVFGNWGFPRMGVEGSGLASCISSYIGAALMLAWSLRGELRERFQYYRAQAVDSRLARDILRLAWPSGVAVVLAMSGFGFFMYVVDQLDLRAGHVAGEGIYKAATSNIINFFQLVFISCIAYGSATATLVGQNMGARKIDAAENYVWTSAKIGAVLFTAVGLLTCLYPHAIMALWSKDQAVIEVATPILRVLGACEPVACLALVFTYALYGAGNARFVMVVEGSLHFTCLMPASYLLGLVFGLGIWGVWIAMMAYIVLMACIMAAKFTTGTWKAIHI
ncbi:MAG TPA: MATE family efflux transporter [Polyangia bacterium]|jgi:putative MATE family efflux protein|nr:MATE family efflux transporter [Polyangia bacterium]